jgi:hypothetical protein
MNLPFTPEEFFAVFRRYNETVWPLQVLFTLLGFAALALVRAPGRAAGRIICAILAALWVWMGLVYHLIFFLPVNPAAALFGPMFLFGAALFGLEGVAHHRLRFGWTPNARCFIALGLAIYALIIYPLVSQLLGRDPAEAASFGLPCPTAIFTIAMLGFLERPFPRNVFLVPLLWAAVGAQAARLFGVFEDVGLLLAGLAGAWFALGSAPARKPA